MKVVLFCGGLGMRLREHSESIPKPLVRIGERPILWHLMKYYAHFGHKDFILCLGWKAAEIKQYFINYNEWLSNDFVLSARGREVDLLSTDMDDWSITFVDTGADANVGQRLKAVQPHLQGEETFLANYADGLTDLQLPDLLTKFNAERPVGLFLSVRPRFIKFHTIASSASGLVTCIEQIGESDVWMNGGFFAFDQKIFDYIQDGEELVNEPFERLIADGKLRTLKYDGFWGCMDTFKEKEVLEDLHAHGPAPWELWKKQGSLSIVSDGTVPRPSLRDGEKLVAVPGSEDH